VSGVGRRRSLRYHLIATGETLESARELILGVSGASGSKLALRALTLFTASPDVDVLHLVVSRRALLVARDEVSAGVKTAADFVVAAGLAPKFADRVRIHPPEAIDAPIASGSYRTLGMAVLPCSAGTLASIANGLSRGLLQRAADVCLKERRRLVLGLRETPLSAVHAENILRATQAGAVVAPTVPAFYAVATLDEAIDAYLLRVADLLSVSVAATGYRWKGVP
jgi:flavin prenyltransferase